MNKLLAAAAAALLMLAPASVCAQGRRATATAQTPAMQHTSDACGALTNASYAVQLTGQVGESPGMHVVTGVWRFGADGHGTGSDRYIMAPTSGYQSRSYEIACGGADGDGRMTLTISGATNGTLNANGSYYIVIAGAGARFAIANSGANGLRFAGWAERQ